MPSGCLCPTLLPVPDSFQARFACTADCPGYKKQRELQCRALGGCRALLGALQHTGLGRAGHKPPPEQTSLREAGNKSSCEQTSCAVTMALAPLLCPQLELILVFPGYPDPSTDTAPFSPAQPSACL